ncbi:hypothetical protein Vadar_005649 [Vaccinium darrowii]|uniref:Uncharacterized protein n=1 Tax=Vaccinium darrowii TaxID=229202 RepID=A0ACB7XYI4_9ERIC|nr:hypothetical protein Vadar_005649 [Vaccinium darrowii]
MGKFASFHSWSIGRLQSFNSWSVSLSCDGDGGKKNPRCGPTAAKEKNDGGAFAIKVFLKISEQCDCCEEKIKRLVRSFEGVVWVERNDEDPNQLTVIGKMDPEKLREMLEKKMKRKVELVSSQPKKDKVIPVTTAMMKVNMDCQQRFDNLCNTVLKTKGLSAVSFEKEKNQLTVTGAIDMKALAESLTAKLKTAVVIVPPENGGGGSEGDRPYACNANRGYVNGYAGVYPGYQMSGEENPNACSIM